MNQEQISLPLLSVLGRISDGVFGINLNGEVEYLNDQAVSLFGMNESDCIGKQLDQLFNDREENAKVFFDKINQSIESQLRSHFEAVWPKDETKWVEVNLYPSSDGITIWVKDITSKKKVHETIEDKHQKLALLMDATYHLYTKNEPKEIFDSLFNELAEHLDLDVYFNYQFNESEQKLQLMNYAGVTEAVAKELEWLEMGEAVCGCVALSQKRIVAEKIDSSDDPRVQLVKGMGIKTYACHPLMSYGKFVGTLSFGSSKRSKFTEEEIALIYKICNQLAVTLDRLSLITELTRKRKKRREQMQQNQIFFQ